MKLDDHWARYEKAKAEYVPPPMPEPHVIDFTITRNFVTAVVSMTVDVLSEPQRIDLGPRAIVMEADARFPHREGDEIMLTPAEEEHAWNTAYGQFYGCDFLFNINDLPTRSEILQWYLDLNDGGVAHTLEEIEKVRALLEAEA